MGCLTQIECKPHSFNKYLEVINASDCTYCTFYAYCAIQYCQLMTPQLTFVFFSSFRRFHSSAFSGFTQSGSSSTMCLASLRASCTICPSRAILAIFKSKAIPLCTVPSKSPGPRNLRSAYAMRKPSLVWHMMSIRFLVS